MLNAVELYCWDEAATHICAPDENLAPCSARTGPPFFKKMAIEQIFDISHIFFVRVMSSNASSTSLADVPLILRQGGGSSIKGELTEKIHKLF